MSYAWYSWFGNSSFSFLFSSFLPSFLAFLPAFLPSFLCVLSFLPSPNRRNPPANALQVLKEQPACRSVRRCVANSEPSSHFPSSQSRHCHNGLERKANSVEVNEFLWALTWKYELSRAKSLSRSIELVLLHVAFKSMRITWGDQKPSPQAAMPSVGTSC